MKQILCVLLCVLLVLPIGNSVFAEEILPAENNDATLQPNNDLPPLSELSDEECLAFLEQSGIEIPTVLSRDVAIEFARMVIRKVEADPNHYFAISYSGTLNFAEAIREAVNNYYGVSVSANASIHAPASVLSANWLQDSEVYGE